MTLRYMLVALPLALCALGHGPANAGQTIHEEADLACVVDKWDEKEPEKGHKLVDYASRCVIIPDGDAGYKAAEVCTGNFEYKSDGSWKGTGTCTDTLKGGDTMFLDLGRGVAPQGIRVHQDRRHGKIPGRQGRRHLHV